MQTNDFFKAGGTLDGSVPSYIKRPADDMLLRQVAAGHFCYVLTPRQMGKSSLMIRTTELFRNIGIQTALVNLSEFGSQATLDQWYLGILTKLVADLTLDVVVAAWWQARRAHGVVQRFIDFISEVVLVQMTGPIVIFIDEIDAALGLDFSDDFFAALRAIYNERAIHADYKRLTFVLLGVAVPTNLIKERSRTPFNIGQAIELKEFDRAAASLLECGLNDYFPGRGTVLLDRIFYWTAGHPYLTQKLCSELTKTTHRQRQSYGADVVLVDALVDRLYLVEDSKDTAHLQPIRSRLKAHADVHALLGVYRCVCRGETVSEDERSPWQNELKLAGLITSKTGILCVRNEIYRHVFNQTWIDETAPIQPKTLTAYLSPFLSPLWRSMQKRRASNR